MIHVFGDIAQPCIAAASSFHLKYETWSSITRRATSRMVKTALHKGQVIFLQLNPTPVRLSCSTSTSLDFSGVGEGWQDPNSSTRAQVSSPAEGSRVGSLMVLAAGVLRGLSLAACERRGTRTNSQGSSAQRCKLTLQLQRKWLTRPQTDFKVERRWLLAK